MLIRIDMKSYDVECPSGFVAEHLGANTLSLDFQRAAQRGQGSVRGKQSLNFDGVVWSEKKTLSSGPILTHATKWYEVVSC